MDKTPPALAGLNPAPVSVPNPELAALADELLAQLGGAAPLTPEEREAAALAKYNGDVERREKELQARREDRERRRVHIRDMLLADLPPKVRHGILSGAYSEGAAEWPAVSGAVRWWRSDSRALLIRGGVGGGKTVAAGLTAYEAIFDPLERALATGLIPRVVSWHRPDEFVSAMLHSYDPNAPKLGDSLIIIDDVGLETKPDFVSALCAFLDDHDQRLIMTTNLTKADFRERMGLRVVDRLLECGQAITIKGESRRKRLGDF